MCVPSEHLYDSYNTETYFLNWTPEGQLKTIAAPCRGYIRNHKWNHCARQTSKGSLFTLPCRSQWSVLTKTNEAGQLAAVVDNNHCGFYAYDGNGERVYKLTGASLVRQVNAGNVVFVSGYDDEVVYVNPYMVLTPQGYTKHYYKGKERLAARVVLASENDLSVVFSNQLSIPINTNIVKERIANALSYFNFIHSAEEQINFHIGQTFISSDGAAYDQLQWECVGNDRLTFTHYVVADSNLIAPMFLFSNPFVSNHQSIYYYHGDHLGSASWITDDSGMPIQFIHYQPFGELYTNYKTTAYDERYKFIGKERDTETDYDYFGARYYASICPSWISVDPLADNYPGLNPYAYCGWNPIKFVDPDGRKIVIGSWFGRILAKIGFNNFESKVMLQLGKLKDMDSELNKMIISLEESNITFYIEYENNKNNYYNNLTNTIKYDPDDNIRKDGQIRPPEAALAHELGHAENDKNGDTVKYDRAIANGEKGTKKEQATEQSKRDLNEINSIYYENIVREKEGYPLRGYNYYAGD